MDKIQPHNNTTLDKGMKPKCIVVEYDKKNSCYTVSSLNTLMVKHDHYLPHEITNDEKLIDVLLDTAKLNNKREKNFYSHKITNLIKEQNYSLTIVNKKNNIKTILADKTHNYEKEIKGVTPATAIEESIHSIHLDMQNKQAQELSM